MMFGSGGGGWGVRIADGGGDSGWGIMGHHRAWKQGRWKQGRWKHVWRVVYSYVGLGSDGLNGP